MGHPKQATAGTTATADSFGMTTNKGNDNGKCNGQYGDSGFARMTMRVGVWG
jgi:hypothetical protein